MNSKAKRLLSWLCVLALCMSLLPMTALAAGDGGTQNQVVSEGGTVYYDKDGKTVDAISLGDNNSVVKMTKTVASTEKGNEFDVTLNVKTNQNLTELSSENPDAAVVLVLDVSGSMDWCANCGNTEDSAAHTGSTETIYYCRGSSGDIFERGWDGKCIHCGQSRWNHRAEQVRTEPTCTQYESRLEAAKEAACDFLDDFAALTAGEGETAYRWVKVIKFESSARTVNESWIDVSTEQGLTSAKKYINGLEADGGTNIEAGLQLARNNLNQRNNTSSAIYNVDYLYTVLLTDGKPTYGTAGTTGWDSSSTSYIGYSGDSGSTTNYSDVDDVDALARDIQSMTLASQLYSICFGTDSEGTEVWKDDLLDNTGGAPWDYENPTVEEWLKSWSDGAYSGGADGSDLLENFQSIMTQIALSTKAFIVKDEMGQYMTSAAIQPDGTVHNDASVSGNTLTWRILFSEQDGTSTYEEKEDGTITGYLSYTLKYKVTLDNLQNPGTTLDEENVNSNATLTYAVQKEDGTWDGEVQQGTFAVPKVKSHYGNLTFTKEGSDGKKLEGVTFTLTTADKDGWSMPATSNQDGTVSFTNIPSGHTYTLTETSTPEGYIAADPITVTVSNGTVTTMASETGGSSIEDNVLINQAKTGSLTVTKTVEGLDDGLSALPKDFTITVTNSEDEPVATLKYGTDDNKNDTTYYSETGTWTVSNLAPGDYTVSESNYEVEGYSVEATKETPATVVAGQTANADLTNTYTANTYGLTVEKTVTGMSGETVDGKKMAKPNDTLTYTITVTNTGNTERNNVTVTDTFMVGDAAGKLTISEENGYAVQENDDGTYTITIESLAAADSTENGGEDAITITATYDVTADDAGKTITNTAVASDGDEDPNNDPKDDATTTVEDPSFTVAKTAGVESVKVGERINYTVTITNTGNVDLTDIVVKDDKWAAGEEITVTIGGSTYTYTVSQDGNVTLEETLPVEGVAEITYSYVTQDNDQGELTNTVTVDPKQTDPQTDTETTTVTEADNPAISITKTASVKGLELKEGDTVDVGDTITYTLKVENTGNTSFDTVTVTDTMWTSGKVTQITQKIGDTEYLTNLPENGIWTIVPRVTDDPTFDPGETWTCTYTYTVQDGDTTIKNTATVSTTDGGPDGSDTITIPVTGYDLSIDKVLTSVNGDPYQEGSKVRPGDVLTYTINVTNNNEETVTSFTVKDSLWKENQVETITIGAATADVTGGSYLFQGTLYQGDTWTCTYDYTVPEDVASVSNTAVIDLPGDNDPDDTVTVEVEPDAPGLKVEKSLSQVNGSDYTGGKVSVGDKLTYTIQVTNTGNTTLSRVTVEDSLWNYEDAIQVDGQLAYVADGGTYTIKHDIASGDTVTITYTYTVLRSDAGDTLTNTATVTTPDDGTTGEDTTETPVKPVTPIRPPVDPDKPELNTEDHYAYIVGYPDGNVKPEGNITRAEVATIFFRLLTDESRDEFWSQTNPYSDVSADDWYNNAVSTLTNAGIIDGYEDGTFKPNGNITRAEFATIAVRFFEATYEGENLFPDIDGHWAQDYINEAANAGIVDGYPDGTFGPQKLITRAEAMTMVNRTIDRHPDAEHLLDDMIVWPDNPETAWYYEQVQEATNSHTYTMHTDAEKNPYEIWSELLPVRDWAQLEKEWSDAHSGQTGGEVV